MLGSSSKVKSYLKLHLTNSRPKENPVNKHREDYLSDEELDLLPILGAVDNLEKILGIRQTKEVSGGESFDEYGGGEGRSDEEEKHPEDEVRYDEVHKQSLCIDSLEPKEGYHSTHNSEGDFSIPSGSEEEDELSNIVRSGLAGGSRSEPHTPEYAEFVQSTKTFV